MKYAQAGFGVRNASSGVTALTASTSTSVLPVKAHVVNVEVALQVAEADTLVCEWQP